MPKYIFEFQAPMVVLGVYSNEVSGIVSTDVAHEEAMGRLRVAKKWFPHGELIKAEVDTDLGTCVILRPDIEAIHRLSDEHDSGTLAKLAQDATEGPRPAPEQSFDFSACSASPSNAGIVRQAENELERCELCQGKGIVWDGLSRYNPCAMCTGKVWHREKYFGRGEGASVR